MVRAEVNHEDKDSAVHQSHLGPEGAVCMKDHNTPTRNKVSERKSTDSSGQSDQVLQLSKKHDF